MYNITLICTKYQEFGRCNSDELCKIIEPINPDIIFNELSPNAFSATYGGEWPDTLETKTIKSYLENHPIPHLVLVGAEHRKSMMNKLLKLENSEPKVCWIFNYLQIQDLQFVF